jgi:hypothetical protein
MVIQLSMVIIFSLKRKQIKYLNLFFLFFYLIVGSKICIFGGYFGSQGMADSVPPINPIVLLDTTTLKWSVPELDNPNVPLIYGHSATLIYNNFMFVAFGGKLFFLLKKKLAIF